MLAPSTAGAQDDCGTSLDRAIDLYENASFTEVISLLNPCLEKGLVEEERWQAYRLLALSYLFLNDVENADMAIRKLLEINPRYQPNPGRDPIELIRPLQSYGSYPRFHAGPKGGLSYSIQEITERHLVAGNSDLSRSGLFLVGNDFGLTFDLAITPSISFAIEMLYSSRSFGYTAEPQPTIHTEYAEHLSWLNIPLLIRYQFDAGSVRPFIYGGYSMQALLGASSDFTTTVFDLDSNAEPAAVRSEYSNNGVRSTTDRRSALNHGLVAGAGILYPLGAGLIMIDLRYEHGLAQLVRPEARFTDNDAVFRFLHVDDDFRIRSFGLQIGYVFEFGFTVYRK